jgi:hypothetical protein
MCTFGVGLEEGLKRALILTAVLGVVSWFLFPPIAGIITGVIVTAGWIVFFLTMTMSFSWFFNPYCMLSPQTLIYSLLFPNFPVLPMVPVCAAEEIRNLLEKYIVACSDFLLINFFDHLSDAGIECRSCPYKYELYDCDSFGFVTQSTVVGYFLQRYWPNGNDYLNQTCLVKGGCFLNPIGFLFPAPLESFFEVKYNISYYPETNTPTEFTETLDACGYSYIVAPLSTLLFGLFILYLLLPLALEIFEITWTYLSDVFSIYPFRLLVVWPLTYVFPVGGDPYRLPTSYPGYGRSSYDSSSSFSSSLYNYKRKYKAEKSRKKKKKNGKEKIKQKPMTIPISSTKLKTVGSIYDRYRRDTSVPISHKISARATEDHTVYDRSCDRPTYETKEKNMKGAKWGLTVYIRYWIGTLVAMLGVKYDSRFKIDMYDKEREEEEMENKKNR